MKTPHPRRYLGLLAFLIAGLCAHADPLVFNATLSGAAEAPPNDSAGTGTAWVTYDGLLHSLRVQVTFSGLTGTVSASHIHAATAVAGTGTAGVATQTPTFVNFPLGVTSGTYDNTFDLTNAASWNASYITAHGGTVGGAESDFVAALNDGKTYLNIHTSYKPGGEIRGFLNRVPDTTATAGLLLLGLSSMAWFARHRTRRSN